MRQFSIKLTDENYLTLKNCAVDYSLPINRTINHLIAHNLNDSITIKKLSKQKNLSDTPKKELKIRLTEAEHKKLKEMQKINLHSSISKEAKYHILNAIYDENFLSQIALNNLAINRSEIYKIAININQFIKLAHQNRITQVSKNLENNIQLLLEKIDTLKDKINELIKANKQKL